MDASLVAVAPPMRPLSPPGSLDLYGKRRQMVKVQALEREIHHLEVGFGLSISSSFYLLEQMEAAAC